jgi:hypothetical protein
MRSLQTLSELFKNERAQLEKLKILDSGLRSATPDEAPGFEREIDGVLKEIAWLVKEIRDWQLVYLSEHNLGYQHRSSSPQDA